MTNDPSGIDMTRDMEDRLGLFARDCGTFEMRRIALTWEQIKKYKPPPNPAKETDSRHAGYKAKYGDESWELDALNPKLLSDLIDKHVSGAIDDDAWQEREELIELKKAYIAGVAKAAPDAEEE